MVSVHRIVHANRGFTGDHDLLWQKIVSPYSLLVDSSGPVGGATNELNALQRSNILQRFQQVCQLCYSPLFHLEFFTAD